MRRLLSLIATLVLALLVAPPALAVASSRATSVELRAIGKGVLAPSTPTRRFTLAGVRWRGPGTVLFRARSVKGGWSAWHAAAPEADDGPDLGSAERASGAWRLGNPWWVGASDRIQAKVVGRVRAARAELVWSPELRVPFRAPADVQTPAIVPRASWGADESIRRAPPTYAPAVRFVLVHHTAGTNDYTRAQAAAIVRGIELFHVKGNGWNDIGYNFLVDRFGTVYEGRFGGIDRNVVGAHALGFNTGSVGIALLGTYTNTKPSAAAQDAIARLIAWRLDLAHVDPTSVLTVTSGGSERWPKGAPVVLRAVSGHRDTGSTECPGDQLYARLGAIAAAARAFGGAKIFAPTVETDGISIEVGATLSRSQPWTVVVTSAAGLEVARGSGSGTTVDWTWDSSKSPPGVYTWTISSGAARPATGTIRAGTAQPPLAIEGAALDPETISPNGDGQADTAQLSYRLTAPAEVTVEITDAIGNTLATPIDHVPQRAGLQRTTIDGTVLADGTYNVAVSASDGSGAFVQTVVPLTVNRTLGLVAVTPAVFSPNGDGRNDQLTLMFTLAVAADVTVRIDREGRWVATPLAGTFQPGIQQLVWNGTRSGGALHDGSYEAVVEASDGITTTSYSVPFTSDMTAPRVRILDAPGIRLYVSEPATLTLRIDGRTARRTVEKAGTVRIAWRGSAAHVRVVAMDPAGNVSAPATRVRRN